MHDERTPCFFPFLPRKPAYKSSTAESGFTPSIDTSFHSPYTAAHSYAPTPQSSRSQILHRPSAQEFFGIRPGLSRQRGPHIPLSPTVVWSGRGCPGPCARDIFTSLSEVQTISRRIPNLHVALYHRLKGLPSHATATKGNAGTRVVL